MIKDKDITLEPETEIWLNDYFNNLFETRGKNFGNARTVRNIFEAALQKQSSRVSAMVKNGITDSASINTLIREDIEK
jgi:hypothetical protein